MQYHVNFSNNEYYSIIITVCDENNITGGIFVAQAIHKNPVYKSFMKPPLYMGFVKPYTNSTFTKPSLYNPPFILANLVCNKFTEPHIKMHYEALRGFAKPPWYKGFMKHPAYRCFTNPLIHTGTF